MNIPAISIRVTVAARCGKSENDLISVGQMEGFDVHRNFGSNLLL
jgi:hypothetical protein